MLGLDELQFSEEYKNHEVFDEIKYIRQIYDDISNNCVFFLPNGTNCCLNYASCVFDAIQGTLDSIQTILKIGRINDAYALTRKYYDDVLLEIYVSVILKNKYDWTTKDVVKEVDEWLESKSRIPTIKKVLEILGESDSTKELFPYFGWQTYFKTNRELLDDSVHGNRFNSVILNCNRRMIPFRENNLQNILIIINQIFTMHLAFIFYLNPYYMMESTYSDYLDLGITPPEGSEKLVAKFAQEAYNKYIKKDAKLAAFLQGHCYLNII